MSTELMVVACALLGLNLLAVAFYVCSLPLRLVLAGSRQRARSMEPGSPFADSPTVRDESSTLAERGDAAEASGLERWIREVERLERDTPAPSSGSEEWWRAWAEAGDPVPQAAESCRNERPQRAAKGRAC